MSEKLLREFLSSFELDKILTKYDAENCIVWTKMLKKKGIVKKEHADKVIKILNWIKNNPEKVIPAEDVHYAVEQTLEKILKKDRQLAGVIRTARSRNDLVVSDERMYIKEQIIKIIKLLKELINSIIKIAQDNLNIPMVGYTHLQPAQPVLFSHYVLSFAWWFVRDIERLKDCYKRVDVSVLGSAAFAGSTFEVDRKEVGKNLGFAKVSENSVDSVSDRDFAIEFISCCSIIMVHLSRIAEEFIIWCTPNFGYISLPKELTSGSSIMPQKKNPDYLELIRGKAAKVFSDLVGILALMKNLPLTYNRDMQEDKVYLFSTVDTTKKSLEVINLVFKNIIVNSKKLYEDIEKYSFIFATEFANFLVKELGLNFKLAHKKMQLILEFCVKNKKDLLGLNFEEIKKFLGKNFDKIKFEKLKESLKLENIFSSSKSLGGSSIKEVKIQIKKLKKFLKE